MKKPLFTLLLAVYFMQINIGICQPAATNPTFTTDASGWTDCISTGQPESNTENVYGGTSSTDKVVEVDNGDAFGLCQTISGFTVGNTYTLYMLVSRRTSTGAGGSKYAPATVGLLVDIGSVTDASVTRNNTIYGYSQVAITFTATATSLPLRVDPDPSFYTADPTADPTYGMAIAGIAFFDLLPLNWLSFKAEQISAGTLLIWQTTDEIDNDKFIVQCSSDGINFKSIGVVLAGSPGNDVHSYEFLDQSVSDTSVTYYRLVQVDIDGTSDNSKTISVFNNNSSILVYPNPFDHEINIVFKANAEEGCLISIIDVTGKTVYSSIFTDNHKINIGKELSAGVYIVSIQERIEIRKVKIIKL